MNVELFREIKDAEKRAEELLLKTEKDKEKILQQAKHKSIILVEKGEEEIDKEKEQKIKDKTEKAELIRKEIISKGEQDIKKLRKNSEKNIETAVNFILQKFEESI